MCMKKFYVFLDIDGVLWDWNYLLKNNIKSSGIISTFCPESIDALNYLIETLLQEYKPELVISSTWRHDMLQTVSALKKNGYNIKACRILSTEISKTPDKRALEILSYLKSRKETENFVIIDDEWFDFKQHFDISHIIKTDMFKGGLDRQKVDNFLKLFKNKHNQDNTIEI